LALTPDEQRALLHQANAEKRLAFQQGMQAKLSAPPEPATTTKRNWEPLKRGNNG